MAAHRDLGFGAEDRFFKFQVEIFAQIGAALRAAAAARPASAKNFSEAKEIAENVAEILEMRVEIDSAACAAADAGMAEAVIHARFSPSARMA